MFLKSYPDGLSSTEAVMESTESMIPDGGMYDTLLSTLPLDDTPLLPEPVANGFLVAVDNVDNETKSVALLSGSKYSIGRRPGSSVTMANLYVSKLHCTISVNGNGEAFIANHSGTNGTIINGGVLKQLDHEHRLFDGDQITVVPKTDKTQLCVFEYRDRRFPPGRLLGARYRLDHTVLLGEGREGVVYRVVDRVTLNIFAVKILSRPTGVTSEVQMMKLLDHPVITKVVDYIEEEGVGYLM
jgi:hypothetical protein